MTDPVSRSHDCAQVTVDLAALGRNYATMREKSGGAEAAAVIKADAYGLGMEKVVPKLLRPANWHRTQIFMCSTVCPPVPPKILPKPACAPV
jgi:alanine racemase